MQYSFRDTRRKLHSGTTDGTENGVDMLILQAGEDLFGLRDLVIDGELIATRIITPPGGMFVYTKGAFERFPTAPYPDWAEQKLATSPTALFGPYQIAWPSDPQGNGVGGAGIAPHFMSWRAHAAGYAYLLREFVGTVHRMPIDYARDVSVERFALQAPFDTPIGYTYDIEDALRWDPNAQDYLQFQKHDGQHFARATRSALALRGMHPFVDRFLEMLLTHVRLSYGRRDISPTTNTRLWTCQQWLDGSVSQDQVRAACGRELAHVARLVWALEPDGQLATDIEDMILKAGIPWFLDNRSIYAPESRRSGGGPFGENEPIAHVFELLLMQDAAKKRERLAPAVRAMDDFLAVDTLAGTMNADGEKYHEYGPPFDYLLFAGRFRGAGYADAKGLLTTAGSRGTEDNPLDCCPSRFWRDAL